MIKKIKFALILLPIVLIGCKNRNPATVEKMILPVEIINNTRMAYAQLYIDGNMYNFSIDSTLKKSCINKETAKVIRKYEKNKNKYLTIDSLRWGKHEFNDVQFYIEPSLTSEGMFNGYLGYDFFKSFSSITFDFSTNRIIINDDVSKAESISYREKEGLFIFKSSDKKIAFLPMLVPNMYVDSLEEFPNTDFDVIINSPIPYSQSQYFDSLPEIYKGKDAVIGFDALLDNTVTIDYNHKRLVFNKSINTDPLPYREREEKISLSEQIEKREREYPSVLEVPLQIKNNGMYINIPVNGYDLSFLLDTGAPDNVLFDQGVYKSHIKINDYENSFKYYTAPVKINENELNEIALSYSKFRMGLESDGLLGIEFLNSYPGYDFVQIDYQNRVLRFTNQKPDGQPISIEVKNDIYCNVDVNGKKYKALLDSGWLNYSIFITNTNNELFSEEVTNTFCSLYNTITSKYLFCKSLNLLFSNKTVTVPCVSMSDKEFTKLLPSIFSEYKTEKFDIHLSISFFKKNRITFDFKDSIMWIE